MIISLHFPTVFLLGFLIVAHVSSQEEEICLNDQLCSQEENNTAFDLGIPQQIAGERANEVRELHEKSIAYLKNVVMVEPKYEDVKNDCKNRHEHCAFWAEIGECEANKGYMLKNCALACQTCEMLKFESRCPVDPAVPCVWAPGDLNRRFEVITTAEDFKQFKPRILSRPEPSADAGACDAPKSSPGPLDDESKEPNVGPWVALFENFATPEECERLIELGHLEGYERSSDVGEKQSDGSYSSNVNSGRTSTNAWCNDKCYEDPLAKRVIEKITNVTGVPERNSEYLQLLKYEVGQFYQTHNDYIEYQKDRQEGVRILTLYIYLNDVEEGGGTSFPNLGLTVTPKRGQAVLWPSVLDEDPNEKDRRTDHTALPVIKGIKYGANAWVHQKDFKTPNNNGCT